MSITEGLKRRYYEKVCDSRFGNPIMKLLSSYGIVKNNIYKAYMDRLYTNILGEKTREVIPTFKEFVVTYPEKIINAYVNLTEKEFIEYIYSLFIPYNDIFREELKEIDEQINKITNTEIGPGRRKGGTKQELIQAGSRMQNIRYMKKYYKDYLHFKTINEKEFFTNLSVLELKEARKYLFALCGGIINYTNVFYHLSLLHAKSKKHKKEIRCY